MPPNHPNKPFSTKARPQGKPYPEQRAMPCAHTAMPRLPRASRSALEEVFFATLRALKSKDEDKVYNKNFLARKHFARDPDE